MTTIDLDDFIPADTQDYEVLQPGTGAKTGWVLTLAGPYHPKAVAWAQGSAKKRLQRNAMIEAQQLNGRKIKPEDRDADELKAENMSFLTSRIIDWTPIRIGAIGPEPISFSDEAVARVFGHTRMGWAYQQVIDLLNDEATFTKRSATT